MAAYHYIEYKTLAAPKMRLVRVSDCKIWDNTNSELSSTPTYSDTVITLTRNTYVNGIPVTIPATLPSGKYDMLFYDIATPTNTDEVSKVKRIWWDGQNLEYAIPQVLDV